MKKLGAKLKLEKGRALKGDCKIITQVDTGKIIQVFLNSVLVADL